MALFNPACHKKFIRSTVGIHLIAQKFNSSFVAELKPSKNLQYLVQTIHGIALVACFANALPLTWQFAVALLICLNFKITYPKFNTEKRKIRFTEKSSWEIANGDDFETIEILSSTVITTAYIFLHLKNKAPIVVASDALNQTEYRQFIVKLKITIKHSDS